MPLKRRHQRTLEQIFTKPIPADIRWHDVEALFVALGLEVEEREGSRVGVAFPGQPPRVFHRPHPRPEVDKGAVKSIRQWLESNGVTPP